MEIRELFYQNHYEKTIGVLIEHEFLVDRFCDLYQEKLDYLSQLRQYLLKHPITGGIRLCSSEEKSLEWLYSIFFQYSDWMVIVKKCFFLEEKVLFQRMRQFSFLVFQMVEDIEPLDVSFLSGVILSLHTKEQVDLFFEKYGQVISIVIPNVSDVDKDLYNYFKELCLRYHIIYNWKDIPWMKFKFRETKEQICFF